MNILYLWDADYPWDVRAEKICGTLAGAGHSVHLVARNLKRRPEREEIGGVQIHRLPAFRGDGTNYALSFPAFFSPVWKSVLDRVIRQNGIDLIIVRDLPMAIAGILAGRRHRIPAIFDMAEDYVALVRDIWNDRKFQGLNLVVRNPYFARAVESYTLRHANHVLVVVEEARDLVMRRGVGADRVAIVGNTPPLEAFDPKPTGAGVDLQFMRGRYAVIYTGGIQMGRGIQTVFEAIPKVLPSIPDFLFVVVGDGYASTRLRQMIAPAGLEHHVAWVGWVDHDRVFDYIGAASAGVIPHLVSDHVNTTIPNKIFDYMGVGIPVVASDARPLTRVVNEEACGVTFRSGDGTDLARAFLDLRASGAAFGENGRRAVRSKYHWGEDARRLSEAIDAATGSGRQVQ
jgi:glycosyltransferase involved in cell wall biosynthesis